MSTEIEHTPGPWKAVGRYIIQQDGGILAFMPDKTSWNGGQKHLKANARLIANAPELATLAGRIATATVSDWERQSFLDAVVMAAAALHAKVEGRA